MKFSISREVLLQPLSQVVGVVERRQTLPVLANFLLAARDGRLTVTGTDMEVELISSVPADVSLEGEITVPARKLVDKHAKDDEYRIFLSRLISVLTIIVILIGLVAIFERSFMVFATSASAAMGGWIKAIEDLIFSLFSGA